MTVRVIEGDCREWMEQFAPYDLIIADPPYGDTSLEWDRRVVGWERRARAALKPTGSMWVFGSMRFFMETARAFPDCGWRYAQDVVWEKHNGSGFAADRFKRVHEHVVQFYQTDAPWSDVWNEPQKPFDAVARAVPRKKGGPKHTGRIEGTPYRSEDGGPRLMRSVLQIRSCHGRAIHPTEKPVALLETLIRTSCPPDGLVADLFAGSGAVGEACAAVGRRYVGFEINADRCLSANRRLEAGLFTSGHHDMPALAAAPQ